MRIDVATSAGPAEVELERPRSARALLVLTHGAGGGVQTRDLLAVRAAAVRVGIAVALVTQPYRVAGRRAPPTAPVQDDAWRTITAALRRRRGFGSVPLIVGGRSNGARVACRTAVADSVRGVLALAFPLHPPGRPDISRLDELDAVDEAGIPTLVVQGTRDPFGMPPPGRLREIAVVAGDHALKADVNAVAGAALEWLQRTLQ